MQFDLMQYYFLYHLMIFFLDLYFISSLYTRYSSSNHYGLWKNQSCFECGVYNRLIIISLFFNFSKFFMFPDDKRYLHHHKNLNILVHLVLQVIGYDFYGKNCIENVNLNPMILSLKKR